MLIPTQTFSGEKSIKDDIYDDREVFSSFSYYQHSASFDPDDDAIVKALKLVREGDEVLEHAMKHRKVVTINLQPTGKSFILAVGWLGAYFSTAAGHAIVVVGLDSERLPCFPSFHCTAVSGPKVSPTTKCPVTPLPHERRCSHASRRLEVAHALWAFLAHGPHGGV